MSDIGIQFLKTGYTKRTTSQYIRKGAVKDPYLPKVCGVGFYGEGPFNSGKNKRIFICWKWMLNRCYIKESPDYLNYGGRGVEVCEDWHNFQNFAGWAVDKQAEGLYLDKDLRKLGNKLYSPDFCEYVPIAINSLLTNHRKGRGDYPIGVHKYRKRFVAQCANNQGAQTHIGVYDTPEQAFLAYKQFKEAFIKEVAQKHFKAGSISKPIYDNLMTFEVIPYPEIGEIT